MREIDFDRERHRAWITAAEAKVAAIVADEGKAAKRASYDAAKAERDALAAELRDKWAPTLEAFAAFLARLEANAAQLPAINAARPNGAEALIDAEMLARGYGGNLCWRGASPVKRLVKMTIPRFAEPGDLWPVDRFHAAMAQAAEAEHKRLLATRAARSPEAVAARKAAEDARHGRFRVRVNRYPGTNVGPIPVRGGQRWLGAEEATLELDRARLTELATRFNLTITEAPPEVQRYRVSVGRDGYSGGLMTVAGPAQVGSRPIEVEMTEAQAEDARRAGRIVECLGPVAPAAEAAVPEPVAAAPAPAEVRGGVDIEALSKLSAKELLAAMGEP
ncbi:MAG: hypothetical protein A4S16_03485 [Proteobacteria bacterium SG_bin6]|nr:MAG: hypothetical protein A4S16_03485 [Proteobacteria bacterium SG_bin6]